jgi:hypothetical protein
MILGGPAGSIAFPLVTHGLRRGLYSSARFAGCALRRYTFLGGTILPGLRFRNSSKKSQDFTSRYHREHQESVTGSESDKRRAE